MTILLVLALLSRAYTQGNRNDVSYFACTKPAGCSHPVTSGKEKKGRKGMCEPISAQILDYSHSLLLFPV